MPSGVYKHKPQQGFQKGHTLSTELIRKISRYRKSRFGKLSHNWKGAKASYYAKHIWLKNNFGKAHLCENVSCVYPKNDSKGRLMLKPKRYEWALIHGKFHKHDRKNYIMLCKQCHSMYDRNKLKIKI